MKASSAARPIVLAVLVAVVPLGGCRGVSGGTPPHRGSIDGEQNDGPVIDSGTARPDTAVVKPIVVINEVESSGGVPGDWVELYNAGGSPADLSSWVFKDS